jgi:hypothetical protein
LLDTVLRLAKTVGATPWTVCAQGRRIWDSTWDGGGVEIHRLGPREARLEVVNWPCSRMRYCRIGLRGMYTGLFELFCTRSWAQDIPALCTDTSLGYRLHWV